VHAAGAAVLVAAAEQRQRHAGLHVAVPVDRRSDRPDDALADLGVSESESAEVQGV